jgi:hypothetical protein
LAASAAKNPLARCALLGMTKDVSSIKGIASRDITSRMAVPFNFFNVQIDVYPPSQTVEFQNAKASTMARRLSIARQTGSLYKADGKR